MDEQPELFDWKPEPARVPASAEAVRDQAIETVRKGATDEERQAALDAVRGAALALAELTTDDVWDRLNVSLREGRLLGWAMHAGAKAGWIVALDHHRKSRRVENHARPLRVWRSLLYQGR